MIFDKNSLLYRSSGDMTKEEEKIVMDTLSNIKLKFSHEADGINLQIQSGFYTVKIDVTEIVEKVIKDRNEVRLKTLTDKCTDENRHDEIIF
jgi:hypothetical protein